jgi:hypothetical protein
MCWALPLNPLKSSGNYTYHPCNIKSSEFCPRPTYKFHVIPQLLNDYLCNIINKSIFVMKTQCVYSEVWTELPCIIYITLTLQIHINEYRLRTLPDWRSAHVPSLPVQVAFRAYRKEIDTCSTIYKVVQTWPGLFVCKQVTVCPGHIWTTLYVLYKKHSSWHQNSNVCDPDRLRHGHPTACVIAQQYSSSTFVSLRFNSWDEKLGTRLKNLLFNCLCF